MSASKVLEKTLDEILSAINPSREDQIARNQIIAELQTVVRSMDIFPGIFASSLWVGVFCEVGYSSCPLAGNSALCACLFCGLNNSNVS